MNQTNNSSCAAAQRQIIEQSYTKTTNKMEQKTMTFGEAIWFLKQGKCVARTGWNGKGMFIFIRPADELHIEFVAKSIKSLPQSVKDFYLRDCIDENGKPLVPEKDDVVKFTAYICMKAADGSIVNGWLASQTDILAEDWIEVEEQ